MLMTKQTNRNRPFTKWVINIALSIACLFSFSGTSFAQTAECSFSSDFQFYEYDYNFENDTDHAITFTVNESQTIFHPAHSFTTSLIPAGMAMERNPLTAYPENVFGTDTVFITITSSDNPDQVIKECQFTHNRVGPTGVILILDRSGSMGLQGKIQAAKTASGAFIDSIAPTTYTSLGYQNNRYGIVLFNQIASILDISPVMPGLVDFEIPGEWINPYAISSLNAVQPDGFTSIGDSLRTGRTIIEEQATNMRRVILLLSDGKENRTPWISSEIDSLVSDAIRVYSIGLGYNYMIDSEKLNALSNATGGRYRHIDDPDTLTNFFMEVLAEAFDMTVSSSSGPNSTGLIPIPSNPGEFRQRHDFSVASLEQEIIFVLSWRDPNNILDVRLVTPSGEISAANLPEGIQYIYRGKAYKIFKVPVSSRIGSPGMRPGNWSAEISAKAGVTEHYSFTVLSKSRAKLLANLPIAEVYVGDDVPISARLLFNDKFVTNAKIEVEVSEVAENFPDVIARAKTDLKAISEMKGVAEPLNLPERKGSLVYKGGPCPRKKTTILLQPSSAGKEPSYSATMKKIKYPGNYDLTFRATWKTEEGETLTRELKRTVLVKSKANLQNSQIKVKTVGKAVSKDSQRVAIDFSPKDMNGNYLGLGLQVEMSLIGPVSKRKGFVDLGNGTYRIETNVGTDGGPLFLSFQDTLWNIPIKR
jgi:hypothetical protein